MKREPENTAPQTAGAAENKKVKAGKKGKIILLAIVAACLAVYFLVPGVKTWVDSVVRMFKTGNFSAMRSFIAQYGPWAMAVSFLLMVFQSVAAPLPAFFITLTNANLFGWWQGAILSWSSAMAGAALCFFIARILGRDVVEKICTKKALEQIDGFFDKYGKKSILVARLLPFISFDIVSYAAGLTSMDFWGFFAATGVGQLPATIVYSYVGGMLTGGAKMMFVGLLCLFSLAILAAIIRSLWTSRQKAKAAAAAAAGIYLAPPEAFNWVRFFNKFYNCALWGMVAAMLSGQNVWIGMRVNLGWIFYGVWLLTLIVFGCIRRLHFGWKFTSSNVAACAAVSLIVFGTRKLQTLPAAILREGLGQTHWHLGTVGTGILIFLIVGYALILALNLRRGGSKKASPPTAAGEV